MVWTETYFNNSSELFSTVEGYFNIAGTPNVILDPIATPTQVNLTRDDYSGRIIFFGTNLAVQKTAGAPGVVFTSGTITRIEYFFNYRLRDASDNGQDTRPFTSAEFLEPSAILNLPNVSATAMSNAVVQSYSNPAALRAFFSADSHIMNGTDKVNIIIGFDGNDTLRGFGGNDALDGSAGDDILDGGPGTDSLAGGPGNDFYLPGPPAPGLPVGDTISDNGTDPNEIDTISYENAPEGLTIDLNPLDGNQSTGWAAGLMAAGIERVIGSPFNDVIIGTDFPESVTDTAADILLGGAGDDVLVGLSGSDVLQGGPGFDVLIGGPDGDIRGPGPGDIAAFAADRNDIDVFRFQNGQIFVAAPGADLDELREVEFIRTNAGVERIGNFANSTKQIFMGGTGPDPLDGSNGPDLMYGREGDDTIVGFQGDDTLSGNDGNDTLTGGPGSDRLYGGRGLDSAVFAGSQSDYTVTRLDTGEVIVEGIGGAAAQGRDVLFDVETAVFGDGQIDLPTSDRPVFVVETDGVEKTVAAKPYEGPVDGVEWEFLGSSAPRETIKATSGADFVNGLAGDDIVFGEDGNDILDGGVGSNFLTGGPGTDIFFTDARDGQVSWSTITDFLPNVEQVTVWGFKPGVSRIFWEENYGAEGFKGATAFFDMDGSSQTDRSGVDFAVTFAGLTRAELGPSYELDGLLWFRPAV